MLTRTHLLLFIAIGLLALALALWMPGAFWVFLGAWLIVCAWFTASLKRAPKIELPNLSPPSQDLLDRYNHAWSAPGLTRLSSFLFGTGQLLCLGAAVVFLFSNRWIDAALLVPAFMLQNFLSGWIDPRGYIKLHGLGESAHELARTYADYMSEYRTNANDVSRDA